jgi:hypothetical protein
MINVGCNTHMHGSNTGNLCVQLSLSQTHKNTMCFLMSLMFSLQQNLRTRGRNRFCLEARMGGGGVKNVYTCE